MAFFEITVYTHARLFFTCWTVSKSVLIQLSLLFQERAS